MVEWRIVDCARCDGHGQLWCDWHGADECPDCGGEGFQYISPSGRLADYPGGLLRGSAPGEYETARPVEASR